jgi:hypothetical protein
MQAARGRRSTKRRRDTAVLALQILFRQLARFTHSEGLRRCPSALYCIRLDAVVEPKEHGEPGVRDDHGDAACYEPVAGDVEPAGIADDGRELASEQKSQDPFARHGRKWNFELPVGVTFFASTRAISS